ncbi:hypothetical protein ACOSQ3_026804 [Xanthoceras sorbifolium]
MFGLVFVDFLAKLEWCFAACDAGLVAQFVVTAWLIWRDRNVILYSRKGQIGGCLWDRASVFISDFLDEGKGGLVHSSGLVGQASGDRVEVPTTKQTAVGVGASRVLKANDVHYDFAVVCGGVLEPSSEQILLDAGGVFSKQVLQVSGGDFLAFSRQLEQVTGGAVLASSRQFLQAVVGVIGQAPRPSVGGLSGQSLQASGIVSLANSGLFQQVVQGRDGGVVLPSSGQSLLAARGGNVQTPRSVGGGVLGPISKWSVQATGGDFLANSRQFELEVQSSTGGVVLPNSRQSLQAVVGLGSSFRVTV